jgi:6-hydroxycyclohex-1-ene-1-carbonyl-CoA dehydrogenase
MSPSIDAATASSPTTLRKGWRMIGPGRLDWFEEPLAPPAPGYVTVEVLGCGVCHTDLGYLYDGVAPAHKGPLVLGHEIVGKVDDKLVLVPAVAPCGECRACRSGRLTACAAGKMPGNHHDGGFATHVQVPSRYLCPVPALPAGMEVWPLAAIADAITTPLQAITRTRLARGDVAVVVGAGGVGGFLVEQAVAVGAIVIAIDPAAARRERARFHGAHACLDSAALEAKTAKKAVAAALPAGAPDAGWHVFECSGSPGGQLLAYALLTRGGKLGVVGFTPEVVPLRLSNLMALDAEAYGNWGADPGLYPEALRLVLEGRIDLASAVGRHSLRDAPAVLEATHHRQLAHRAVLVPEGAP